MEFFSTITVPFFFIFYFFKGNVHPSTHKALHLKGGSSNKKSSFMQYRMLAPVLQSVLCQPSIPPISVKSSLQSTCVSQPTTPIVPDEAMPTSHATTCLPKGSI
ncbi:hypothetical protein GDO86_009396 [Hymenochirus boettgeri]|uniref:Uncharacterized protein n=1 Tax=Hymenochirus boettgeri TaxID=247094 RepID=A0A8T2JKZ1_9PIPI|nr:hypothetical protein GDO86_009396 [Hymenochirus boettgeri]